MNSATTRVTYMKTMAAKPPMEVLPTAQFDKAKQYKAHILEVLSNANKYGLEKTRQYMQGFVNVTEDSEVPFKYRRAVVRAFSSFPKLKEKTFKAYKAILEDSRVSDYNALRLVDEFLLKKDTATAGPVHRSPGMPVQEVDKGKQAIAQVVWTRVALNEKNSMDYRLVAITQLVKSADQEAQLLGITMCNSVLTKGDLSTYAYFSFANLMIEYPTDLEAFKGGFKAYEDLLEKKRIGKKALTSYDYASVVRQAFVSVFKVLERTVIPMEVLRGYEVLEKHPQEDMASFQRRQTVLDLMKIFAPKITLMAIEHAKSWESIDTSRLLIAETLFEYSFVETTAREAAVSFCCDYLKESNETTELEAGPRHSVTSALELLENHARNEQASKKAFVAILRSEKFLNPSLFKAAEALHKSVGLDRGTKALVVDTLCKIALSEEILDTTWVYQSTKLLKEMKAQNERMPSILLKTAEFFKDSFKPISKASC